jgi:PPOX class probable F420-dependent enzyme
VSRFYAQAGGSFDNRFEEAGMETRTTTGLREQDRRILDKKTFAHLATLMPDGSPQVTPVWVDYEGDRIVVNSAEGRVKPRNVREDPRVALAATDPDNPYEAVIVRGRVDEITHDDADEHIDAMAKKYLDRDRYPFRQMGEQRVKIYIQPEVVKGVNE